MLGEGIEPEALGGQSGGAISIEFSSALGLADVDPVGGSITGSSEALVVDEGFQKDGVIGIAAVPVLGELANHLGEHFRGQIGGLDPREDEEASVIDDAVKIFLSLSRSPAETG